MGLAVAQKSSTLPFVFTYVNSISVLNSNYDFFIKNLFQLFKFVYLIKINCTNIKRFAGSESRTCHDQVRCVTG